MKPGKKRSCLLGLALSGCLLLGGAGVFSIAKAEEEPPQKTGKVIVADFDTMHNHVDIFKTQYLADSSEAAFSIGKMNKVQKDGTGFWSADYGLQVGGTNWIGDRYADWTGGKYLSFYLDNTADTKQQIYIAMQYYKGDLEEQLAQQTGAKVLLDDLSGTPVECVIGDPEKNSVDQTTLIQIPANFKGYVKFKIDDEAEWRNLWGADQPKAYYDLSCICGIQVWEYGTEGTLYMDTFVVSYDDDFETPYTADTVKFGRKTETGKTIVVDFDTMYSPDLKTDKLVATTEKVCLAGKMMTVMTQQTQFWSPDYGLSVGASTFKGTKHDNWSSARYLMFYLSNPAETAQDLGVAIQTYYGLAADEQWKQSVGAKVVLDDLKGTPKVLTIETLGDGTTSNFSIPEKFEGYVKVELDNRWNWEPMWGGKPRAAFDMNKIAGIEVWGSAPDVMYMDTFIVSYDDDIETPLTKEMVMCGRVYPVLTEIKEYIESLDYEEADYTPASWNAYMAKLAAAKEVVADEESSQADIDGALAALKEAVANLAKKTDFTALQSKYDEWKDITLGNYTQESYAVFQEKLTAAKATLDDATATQAEADGALSDLVGAYNALAVKVDKSGLQAKYDLYKDIAAGNYTEESYAVFEEKLTAAKAVLDNANATQPQVSAALLALNGAYAALAEKSGESGNPTSSDSGNGGSTTDSTSGESGSQSDTGCGSVISGVSLLSIAALAGVAVLKKKNRK